MLDSTAIAIAFVATLIIGAQSAVAQSTSVSDSSSDSEVAKLKNLLRDIKFKDDSGITDPRLRAEQGSMSRYSGKFSFGYAGPIIGDLSNPYQPNPDASVTKNPTSLRGSMGLRYRMSSEVAMNFGTGISDVTPFADGARTDVSTPFIGIDKSWRANAWQIRESLQGSFVTNPEMRNVGETNTMGASLAFLRNLNDSRWEAGIDTNFNYGFYSRPYQGPTDSGGGGTHHHDHGASTATTISPEASRQGISRSSVYGTGDGNCTQFGFGVSPVLKYRATDKFGAYTSTGLDFYEPRSSMGQAWIWQKTVSQRLGVDYAFTHDIYFSPFVAFYPKTPSWGSTTLNFSSVFSIF